MRKTAIAKKGTTRVGDNAPNVNRKATIKEGASSSPNECRPIIHPTTALRCVIISTSSILFHREGLTGEFQRHPVLAGLYSFIVDGGRQAADKQTEATVDGWESRKQATPPPLSCYCCCSSCNTTHRALSLLKRRLLGLFTMNFRMKPRGFPESPPKCAERNQNKFPANSQFNDLFDCFESTDF